MVGKLFASTGRSSTTTTVSVPTSGVTVATFAGWDVVVATCPVTGVTTTEVSSTCGPGMISGRVVRS